MACLITLLRSALKRSCRRDVIALLNEFNYAKASNGRWPFFKNIFYSHLLFGTLLHGEEGTIYLESSFYNFFILSCCGKVKCICKDIVLGDYRESALAFPTFPT